MGAAGEVWRVITGRRGGTVGDIVIEEADAPWHRGRFIPGPGFASVKPLFERELTLLGRIDEEPEAWEAAYDQVARAVSLVAPRGPVADFLLHIDGDRAWFRWSDTPLTDEA
ncbi:hypothetical protein [Streptomyces sp. NPDC051569]|uniref:hypothetical protein n=1 Tax=Streptomyces sp. NPDC051569 TaxID=3365661 RepID=UPI00378A08C5